MFEFKKNSFIPDRNPFEFSKSTDSKAKFGCDVTLSACDYGYMISPLKKMVEGDCLMKGLDYSELPYWARQLHLHNLPINE